MYLVFDIGGTNTRIALVRGDKFLNYLKMPTDRTKLGLAKFFGCLQELARGQVIKAVAGGFPGIVKDESGEVIAARNLPEWVGLNLFKGIHDMFDCPIHVTNDVVVAGLGEAHFGAGLPKGIMVYYTVSTGVNGVRIVDGALDTTIGHNELGNQILRYKPGESMDLEDFVGGYLLEKRLGKAPEEVKDQAVWDELEWYMAAGLYNTTIYWNPAVIVLGGKMMKDLNAARIAKKLATMTRIQDAWPDLRRAAGGDQTGVRGAMMWLNQLGYKL